MKWLSNLRFSPVQMIVLCGLVLFVVAGRDHPKPDVSDLDIVRCSVSPNENAFTYFAAATNHLCFLADHRMVSDYLSGKVADDARLKDVIAANAVARGLIQQGLACKVCVWPAPDDADEPVVYISEWVRLANVLALTSRHGRLAGEYDEATRASIELIDFGIMTQTDSHGLIMYLVGAGVLEKGLTQARELAHDPGTSTEDLRLLLQALDNKSGVVAQGLALAAKGEYEFGAAIVDRLYDGRFQLTARSESARDSLLGRYMRPFYLLQPNKTKELLAAGYREVIADATRCYADMRWSDTDAIEAHGKIRGWSVLCPNPIGRAFCVALVPALRRVLEGKCHTLCRIDATRLVLAANLYRRGEGRLPASLADLVPKYLDAVPTDPYDGQPFRYVPSRNAVYSVGPDLIDSEGSKEQAGGTNGVEHIRYKCKTKDLVYDLLGA